MGNAKYRPMQQTEDIAIFSSHGQATIYFPLKSGGNNIQPRVYHKFNSIGNNQKYKKTYETKYPTTLIEFDKIRRNGLHPTQKPVPLLEYLIKTYTLENETVLDFTMGSGSTGVACINTNRNFIGIELDENYFNIAKERINKAKEELDNDIPNEI